MRQETLTPHRPRREEDDEDLLAELEQRREKYQELDRLEAEREQRMQDQRGLRTEMDSLQERIEDLLSTDPEEFVIRFLQTEGQ